MEDGRIKDSQITTSSVRFNTTAYAWYALLCQNNKQWSAWCVNGSKPHQYIQIDLLTLKKITGIATQGREALLGCKWANSYKISYRRDNGTWVFYQGKGQQAKARFYTDKIYTCARQLIQLSASGNPD